MMMGSFFEILRFNIARFLRTACSYMTEDMRTIYNYSITILLNYKLFTFQFYDTNIFLIYDNIDSQIILLSLGISSVAATSEDWVLVCCAVETMDWTEN